MNYIVVFRRGGVVNSLFFVYRDESDVAFKNSTLIKNEDDVIAAMLQYFSPDNNDMVIKETLLDQSAFKEDNVNIVKQLLDLLDT